MKAPETDVLVTRDFEYARMLISFANRRIPIPHYEGRMYDITEYEIKNNDEIINYGGFWGGEPGLYRVSRPATYLFKLKLHKP